MGIREAKMLPLPPIAERQERLEAGYGPWQPRTLDQLLDHVADHHPQSEFVVTDTQMHTYRDIAQWSRRLANGLAYLGVTAGEHVAVVLGNYPEFVALKFAIARIGAVMVPINYLYRREELAYALRQSNAVALITMDSFRYFNFLDALDQLAPAWMAQGGGPDLPDLREVVVFSTGETLVRSGVRLLDSLERAPPTPLPARASPTSLCDIIYTSGTTGAPKGVMLTHDMMLRSGYGSAYARAFEKGRRILFSLPLYHVYGYVEGLLASMFVAGAVILKLKFDAADTLRTVSTHRVSDLLLIPTMTLALLAEQHERPQDLSSLRTVLSSGGRAPAYLWSDLRSWSDALEITTGYGMTECTASTTVTRPDDPLQRLLHTNGRLRDVGAAGDQDRKRQLVEYRTINPSTGRDVPVGEPGELIAWGLGVTQGYYRKPEATAETFTNDGWLRTGDLARMDQDGYLTLVGRLKESYRCGGETVMPTDIEDCLVLHPKVLQAHVVPAPDTRMGEVGAAFVVLRHGARLEEGELIEYCTTHLARFKVPKYVIPIEADELPITPSGRARKFMLTEMAIARLGLK